MSAVLTVIAEKHRVLTFRTIDEIPWELRKSPQTLLKWIEQSRAKGTDIECLSLPAIDTRRTNLSLEDGVRAVVEVSRRGTSEKMREYHREAGHGYVPPCDGCGHGVVTYQKRGGKGGHVRRIEKVTGPDGVPVRMVRILRCTRKGDDGISECGCTTYEPSNPELTGRRK